jgi:hypothetical protein
MTSPTRLTLLCAGLLMALGAAAAPAMAQAGAPGPVDAPAAVQAPADPNAPPAAVEEEPSPPYGCPFKNRKLQLLV